MNKMSIKEMKVVNAGGGTYKASCTFDGCTQYYATKYTGAYGGLSWSTAKVLCEGQLYNHVLEVHYDNL